MSKLRDDHRPYQPGASYGAWCWSALSDEYQRKFNRKGSVYLQTKVDRMVGYESLSRNDDIVLAAISYLILNRGPLKRSRTLVSFQDEFPDITVISGSSDALLVRCSEGHEWTVRADNLRDGKRCGICSVTGFNPDKPSWMYLILFVATGILKVGITNRDPYKDDGSYAGRLSEHNDGSMLVLDIVGADDGYQIQADEGQVRRYLKVNGLREGNSYEYWQQDEFPVDNLNTLIQLTKEK